MAEITSIGELVGKDLISYVSYPGEGSGARACFVYPQYAVNGDEVILLDNMSLFPPRGCICVGMTSTTASEARRKIGDVAVLKIKSPHIENPRPEERDRYFVTWASNSYGSTQIDLAALSEHPLSNRLLQVAETLQDVDLSTPQEGEVKLAVEDIELTSMLMVEHSDGFNLSYFGPFTAREAEDGYVLSATDAFRTMVYELTPEQTGSLINVIEANGSGMTVAKFMLKDPLNAIKKRPSSAKSHDWITDAELIAALARVMESASEFNLDPKESRALVKAIKSCTFNEARIYLTDKRKKRMEDLLSKPEKFERYFDVMAEALARPAAASQLAKLACSEEYWPRVKEMLLGTQDIAERIAAEKARLNGKVNEVKGELESLERQRDDLKADVERIRAEVLKDAQAKLAKITEKTEVKERELAELTHQVEQKQAAATQLEESAKRTLERFESDSSALVDGLLVSSAFAAAPQQRAFAGATAQQAGAPAAAERPLPALQPGEDEMRGTDIVAQIANRLAQHANRDLSADEVINLLTCLMSGSITVLSGMPGCGKTSLVEALAGALGLATPTTRRFTRINVEQGWTSHRDYTGYFNPLSGTLQATNSEVLADLLMLDEEARSDSAKTAGTLPYLMLLDEANLSVMENYWAPFIANADNTLTRPVALNMQGSAPVMVPTNTRWMATVNFDHTTESLSPRFLNRAWVVSCDDINADTGLASYDHAEASFDGLPAFSYAKLMEVFCNPEGASLETSQRNLLEMLLAACAEGGMPVSWRCKQAMTRYIASASPLMREAKAAGDIRAVDFAFAQRVIPSINGMGERTRYLIESVAKKAGKQLPKTSVLLANMLEKGSEDGYYQFFC